MKIYLLGFMGSGKTHLGKLLAHHLNWTFLDLDEAIEQSTNKTISTLFAELGEEGFRLLEQQELGKTQILEKAIIATGGGTPCFYNNMNFIKDNGKSVYLNPPISVLHQRLKNDLQRPLLRGLGEKELLDFIESHLAQRLLYYQQADLELDSSSADILDKLIAICIK